MRTTLFGMRLLNDTSQMHTTSFYKEQKGEGTEQDWGREGKRERKGREWEVECSWERVEAWVINLTIGPAFMRA